MPLDDFDLGGSPHDLAGWRTRRIIGLIGLALGAIIGGWWGYASNGVLGLLGGGIMGAGIGGGAAWLFAGYVVLGLIFVVVFAVMFGWFWLTGSG